jgi:hypothetical protein
MTSGSAVIVVILWAVFAWASWAIGKYKGYAGEAWPWGCCWD